MKRILSRLILTICALLCPALASAQGVRWDGITLSPSGRPVPANVSVCTSPGLTTTAAQVIGNTAILTMSSNPITAGFAANMQIAVSGFTGGDTYFNVGTLQPFSSTVTITAVSATTITYPLTHANAAASTNGNVFQMGNVAQACAPLASIFSDSALAVPITQSGLTSSGIGNVGFYVNPGSYGIQYYGTGVTTYLQPLTLTMVFASANNAFTGNNSHSGTESFTGPVTETLSHSFTNAGLFTNTQQNDYATFNINSLNISNEFHNQYSAFATEGLVGAIAVPNTATVLQTNSVAGYATNAAGAAVNAVALFGLARSTSVNGAVWGINTLATSTLGTSTNGLHAAEFDVNALNATDSGVGISMNGILAAGSQILGINFARTGPAPFLSGVSFATAATAAPSAQGAAVYFNPIAAGVNQSSQGIETISNDPVAGQNAGGLVLSAAGNWAFTTSKAATGVSVNGGTALQTTNQSGTGSICMTTSCALATPALTNATGSLSLPTFSTGVAANGSGFKHQRFGGVLGGTCPTAAAIGAACTSGNLNWPTAFADNSYTVVCTLNGSMTGQPHIVSTTYQAAGAGITLTIAADTAAAANVAAAGFVDCTAAHD